MQSPSPCVLHLLCCSFTMPNLSLEMYQNSSGKILWQAFSQQFFCAVKIKMCVKTCNSSSMSGYVQLSKRVQKKPIYWEGARRQVIKIHWSIIPKKMCCVLFKNPGVNYKNVLICKFRDYPHCH